MGICNLADKTIGNNSFIEKLNHWARLSESNIVVFINNDKNYKYIQLFYIYISLLADKYKVKFHFCEDIGQTEADGYYLFRYKNNILKIGYTVSNSNVYRITEVNEKINENVVDLDAEINLYKEVNKLYDRNVV